MFTEHNDECWHCGHHNLALFLWSPRLGQLSQVRDPKVRKHYEDQFKALQADEEFLPIFKQTPHFRGEWSGWKSQPMRDVVEYCK